MDPVGSAKGHWSHRILGQVVRQFQFGVLEEARQFFPECQRVFAGLTGLAAGQHGLARGQNVPANFIEYGWRFFLAQAVTCSVIQFFLARLGVDRKQLVHQLNRANRAGILLVELDRVYKVPSCVALIQSSALSRMVDRRDWMHKHYGPRRCRGQPRSRASTPLRASPRQVAWWLLKQPEEVRPYLQQLDQRSPEIARCAELAREFFRIIRERDTTAWPAWRDATASYRFANFTKHLCHDEAAFLAALEQPWSNGPVEGHIHRLKLIKRSMYGRARFDLLRLRVLHAS